MIYPTLYARFSNILFNDNNIKNSNIYVSTTGSLLQQINISWCRKSNQNYMLTHPDFRKNSIDDYKKANLRTFMLVDCIYATRSLN